jgi:hypothetical protein
MRDAIFAASLLLLVVFGIAPVSAQESSKPSEAPAPTLNSAAAADPVSGRAPHIAFLDKDKTIYVMNFASTFALVPPAPPARANDAPIDPGSMGAPRLNAPDMETPAGAAANLGEGRALAGDLMRGLKKLGYKTKFLEADQPTPQEGLLLTGVFTRTGPDGVLRIVTAGSGQAAPDAEIYVTSANLLRTARPLFEPLAKGGAGDSAGVPIRLNPDVATLKFSVPGDLDAKARKKLSDQIVAELQRLTLQAESQGLAGADDPINKYSKP